MDRFICVVYYTRMCKMFLTPLRNDFMNIFNWFKSEQECEHSFQDLHVSKTSTYVKLDSIHNQITHHLYCKKCNKELNLTYIDVNKTLVKSVDQN